MLVRDVVRGNSSFGFSALALVSAKTKCAVCGAGFFRYETQLLNSRHSDIYLPYPQARCAAQYA